MTLFNSIYLVFLLFFFHVRTLCGLGFHLIVLCQQTVELIGKRGEQPLLHLLNQLGGWPLLVGERWNGSRWSWTDAVARMKLLGIGMDYIVEVSVVADFQNSSKRIVYVSWLTWHILGTF